MNALKSRLLLVFTVLLLVGCTKVVSNSAVREFEMDESPSDAFDYIVNELVAEGFSIDTADGTNMEIRTIWEPITTRDLTAYTSLDKSLAFYRGGRVAYTVSIHPGAAITIARVTAELEANYKPKQGAGDVAPTGDWIPKISNGTLEQNLVAALTR